MSQLYTDDTQFSVLYLILNSTIFQLAKVELVQDWSNTQVSEALSYFCCLCPPPLPSISALRLSSSAAFGSMGFLSTIWCWSTDGSRNSHFWLWLARILCPFLGLAKVSVLIFSVLYLLGHSFRINLFLPPRLWPLTIATFHWNNETVDQLEQAWVCGRKDLS